ncbi:hypothetical protein ACI65C_004839 [Semiaphis heraclei]
MLPDNVWSVEEHRSRTRRRREEKMNNERIAFTSGDGEKRSDDARTRPTHSPAAAGVGGARGVHFRYTPAAGADWRLVAVDPARGEAAAEHRNTRGLGKRERESTPPPPVATHDLRGHTRTHTGRSTTWYDRETTTPRDRRFRFGGFSSGEKISSHTRVDYRPNTVPGRRDNIILILFYTDHRRSFTAFFLAL